jgi:hypothetical protein
MTDPIGRRFLERLVAQPPGRAFMLAFLKASEEADEGKIFDTLVERIERSGDDELAKLVRRHRADEERHAAIFARAVERVGAAPSIPAELHVVTDLDADLGGLTTRFLAGDAGIADVYTLLQVIEERAVREWPAVVRALRLVDAMAAADVEAVIDDERRHVKYARAIARRYSVDDRAYEQRLASFRTIEERTYARHIQVFTRVVLERDLLAVGALERVIWRGLSWLGRRGLSEEESPCSIGSRSLRSS